MSENRYIDFVHTTEESVEYWTESAITDFTEEVSRLMKEKMISRAELARRIGSSQAYVTKVLRGNVNFTLATMTKLARALDSVVRVHLAPVGVVVEWNDHAVDREVPAVFVTEEEQELIIMDYRPVSATSIPFGIAEPEVARAS